VLAGDYVAVAEQESCRDPRLGMSLAARYLLLPPEAAQWSVTCESASPAPSQDKRQEQLK
jgi:hypothetical protein